MRLLNTTTRTLHSFAPSNIPKYAILSHTWRRNNDEEVTLQELGTWSAKRKPGYNKIVGACNRDQKDGWDFIWIDTCSIDKPSSAELSGAINSMFRWYERSEVCYVFLEDVSTTNADDDEFKNSRWFSRGWTLQELLAPSNVHFYNKEWKHIGRKWFLGERLEETTGIALDVLLLAKFLSSYNVAQRM